MSDGDEEEPDIEYRDVGLFFLTEVRRGEAWNLEATIAGWWLFHYSSGGYFYDHVGQVGTGFTAVPGGYDGDGKPNLGILPYRVENCPIRARVHGKSLIKSDHYISA